MINDVTKQRLLYFVQKCPECNDDNTVTILSDGDDIVFLNNDREVDQPCPHLLWCDVRLCDLQGKEISSIWADHVLWEEFDLKERRRDYIEALAASALRPEFRPTLPYDWMSTDQTTKSRGPDGAFHVVLTCRALFSQDPEGFIAEVCSFLGQDYLIQGDG